MGILLRTLFLRIVMVSSILTMLLLTIPTAWSYVTFDYTSYGAATTIAPSVWYFDIYRDAGGNGVLRASDSQTLTYGGVSGTASANADAALGTLGGLASGTMSPVYVGGGGYAYSKFYDTYTIVGSLPLGTPVSISLSWTLRGSFSYQTIQIPRIARGTADLGIVLRVPPYVLGILSQSDTRVSSDDTATVNMGGVIDLSQQFQSLVGQPLTVGDSFILETILTVSASVAFYGSPGTAFTSNFLDTGSLSLSSGTPGASITSLAQQAAWPPGPVPEFGLSSVLIASVLAALYFLRSRPRRIVSQG